MPTKIEKDALTGRETTGHEWDGIRELNNPLPRWWLYVFYASILFSLVYMVLYPAWPGLEGHTRGMLGYSQRAEVTARIAAEQARRAPMMERIAALPVGEIRRDPELMAVVQAAGRVAFADNCAGCHGAGGGGAPGFPSLADDDWIWGGSAEQILQTVTHGVRNEDPESRQSDMPRFGADGLLTTAEVGQLADHVLALSGGAPGGAAEPAGTPGARLFADNCAACHGAAGEGNEEVGAPRLNDGIWLYGGGRPAVVETVTNARRGSMPAWGARLDPATVKILAAYVHSLGGGR